MQVTNFAGSAAAGVGRGTAVGSIVPDIGNLVGAGVGAAIGVFAGGATGAAAGAGIGAGWQKEVYLSVKEVFSRYMDEDHAGLGGRWKIHGVQSQVQVQASRGRLYTV